MLDAARGLAAACLAGLIIVLVDYAQASAPMFLLIGSVFVAGLFASYATWSLITAAHSAIQRRAARRRRPAPLRTW